MDWCIRCMVLKTGPDWPVQPRTGVQSGPVLWKNRKIRKISQKPETAGSTINTANRSGWTGFGPVPLIPKLHRFGQIFFNFFDLINKKKKLRFEAFSLSMITRDLLPKSSKIMYTHRSFFCTKYLNYPQLLFFITKISAKTFSASSSPSSSSSSSSPLLLLLLLFLFLYFPLKLSVWLSTPVNHFFFFFLYFFGFFNHHFYFLSSQVLPFVFPSYIQFFT